MVTSLQDAKWRRLFNAKDFDKKGFVNSDDFIKWGEIVMGKLGLELDDEARGLWAKAGRNYYSNNLKYPEWREYILAFKEGNPEFFEISTQINLELFKCMDAYKNGAVSLKEFGAYVTALFPAMTDEDIKYSFDIIDENGDGVLSQYEVSKAIAHYYWDEGDTKYKHFYGKWDEKVKRASLLLCRDDLEGLENLVDDD